uniref:Uncharacterized protein n=1 Tax=Rhizophora mucronata TaxID=61149 RepID=A0A2P2NUP3_RHIMU
MARISGRSCATHSLLRKKRYRWAFLFKELVFRFQMLFSSRWTRRNSVSRVFYRDSFA